MAPAVDKIFHLVRKPFRGRLTFEPDRIEIFKVDLRQLLGRDYSYSSSYSLFSSPIIFSFAISKGSIRLSKLDTEGWKNISQAFNRLEEFYSRRDPIVRNEIGKGGFGKVLIHAVAESVTPSKRIGGFESGNFRGFEIGITLKQRVRRLALEKRLREKRTRRRAEEHVKLLL